MIGTVTFVGSTDEVVDKEVVHETIVHVVFPVIYIPVSTISWGSSVSVSKNSSSPVSSCSPQVSGKIVPVALSTTHETRSVCQLREKCVPTVVLEKDLRSNKSFLAAKGLIKR